MNQAEQKNHKRVTDQLRADLETMKGDLGVLLAGVANKAQDDTSKVKAELTVDLGNLSRRVTDLRVDCDGVIDRRDVLDSHFWDFVGLGFWARIRWILTGKFR